MEKYTDTELNLAAQVGALRYACEQALDLLEDANASNFDADRVEKLLGAVLRNAPLMQSGNFILGIETSETGGNVTVDLVHLPDGRVLGVNDECVVLYESLDDFQTGGASDAPTIDLLED